MLRRGSRAWCSGRAGSGPCSAEPAVLRLLGVRAAAGAQSGAVELRPPGVAEPTVSRAGPELALLSRWLFRGFASIGTLISAFPMV